MNQKPFDPPAFHAALRGLDSDMQLDRLLGDRITQDQASYLELIAAPLRAGSEHAEIRTHSAQVGECNVCGDLDALYGVDYYWHPLAARTNLPVGGHDKDGDYILSCPECASFNVEAIPTEYLIAGNSLCADCGFEDEDAEFREYLR